MKQSLASPSPITLTQVTQSTRPLCWSPSRAMLSSTAQSELQGKKAIKTWIDNELVAPELKMEVGVGKFAERYRDVIDSGSFPIQGCRPFWQGEEMARSQLIILQNK